MNTTNEQSAQSLGDDVLQAYLDGKSNPNAPHGFCNCSAHERLMIKWWLIGQRDGTND